MAHCPKGNNISGCPWIKDPKDSNHYRCLDCGKHRYINDSSPIWGCLGCLFWIVVALFIIGVLASCEERPTLEKKKAVVTISS